MYIHEYYADDTPKKSEREGSNSQARKCMADDARYADAHYEALSQLRYLELVLHQVSRDI